MQASMTVNKPKPKFSNRLTVILPVIILQITTFFNAVTVTELFFRANRKAETYICRPVTNSLY